jgi:hypothetical protein
MADTINFTLAEALDAQKALRAETGEAEEPLDLEDVVGIAGEEIEILLDKKKSWDEIAAIIQTATSKTVSGADVEKHFNSLGEGDEWDED